MGLFVNGAAAQEPRKSPPPSIQGKESSPREIEDKAKAFAEYVYLKSELGKFVGENDYEKAVEVCKQGIRRWPHDASWHFELGFAYEMLGRYHEAVAAYREAIRLHPINGETHDSLGRAYFKLGRYGEAAAAYKEFIRHNPNDSQAHLCLGLIYVCLGNPGAALQEYQILQTLDKEKAKELFNLIYK
jgi:tetratricopeptide (TPR) repeat protein